MPQNGSARWRSAGDVPLPHCFRFDFYIREFKYKYKPEDITVHKCEYDTQVNHSEILTFFEVGLTDGGETMPFEVHKK